MRCVPPVFLCAFSLVATTAYGQSAGIQPVHVAAGTVLTFYSQTRLNPGPGNALDVLPKGTILRVKLLESIDSSVDRDGLEFRGTLVGQLPSGNEILVRPNAEIRGLLVLLRSRSHPEGFRYELLITSIADNGKSYDFTASTNPSFLETAGQQPSNSNSVSREDAKGSPPSTKKLPETKNQ